MIRCFILLFLPFFSLSFLLSLCRYMQHDALMQFGHKCSNSGLTECRMQLRFHVFCEFVFVAVVYVVEGVLWVNEIMDLA